MNETIINVISGYAENRPDKQALISENDILTYSEFWNEIRCCAAYLQDLGLKKNRNVLIKTQQSPNYLICYYAVMLAGGVPAVAEKNTPDDSLRQIADKLDAEMIISDSESVMETGITRIFANINSLRSHAQSRSDDSREFEIPEDDDTQMIMFTTGTTGLSKGVQISYRGMRASEKKIMSFLHIETYSENGLFVTPTPLNHAKGIWETESMLRAGGSIYIVNGLMDISKYFKALDYPCEKLLLSLVPANLRLLTMIAPDELSSRADKIGAIKLGTAPFLEDDKKRITELLPNTEIHNAYGSSEGGILCNLECSKNPGKAFCIGKPVLDTEVIVVDDERNPISSSKEKMGKLAFRSGSSMIGYYNEPDLTASVFENGILYTNDFGYVDEEGYVFICGRADDVINVGGYKISPDEVESAVYSHPGVQDCICIESRDKVTNKSLKLLIVMKDQKDLDVREFKRSLAKKLEPYKIPKMIEQVNEIARTYNGKLNRKAYR